MELVANPSIPYIIPIYGSTFSPGKMVRIQGTLAATAYRFNIHLQCGPGVTPQDDVAIQVSVRLVEGYIIINSLQNGIWDEEQRGASMPIKLAEKFEIILMCDFSQYKVAINGQHYCEFPQRVHYNRITHLAIDGDVSVMQISYESAGGNGVGSTPGTSAPVSLSVNKEETAFEMVEPVGAPLGIHATPPSYGATIHKEPVAQPLNASSLYTVSASYSTAAPCSGLGVPYPSSGASYPGAGIAYPNSGANYPNTGIVYPNSAVAYPESRTAYLTSGASYPAAGAPIPGMPPPPPGPPVPLNFSRPVQRPGWQKGCGIFCGKLFAIIIIIFIVWKFVSIF